MKIAFRLKARGYASFQDRDSIGSVPRSVRMRVLMMMVVPVVMFPRIGERRRRQHRNAEAAQQD